MGRTRGLMESGRDRRALAADAGFGSLSMGSVLAGVLVAYGAFAVLAGIAAAIVDALNVDTDITTNYEQLGIVGGLIVAGILLLSYLFGGYVAGRMARRSGVLNGLLVAVLGLAIAAGVAALVRSTDAATINENLRSLGVPTTADEYGQAFTVAGIASLAAILLGSLMGGMLGERWHGKLLARAVDPSIGTEAEARKRAEADMARAEEERTIAYGRARATSPTRARRVDRDALSAADRRVLDDDDGRIRDRDRDRDRDRTSAMAAGRNGHNAAARDGRVLSGRSTRSSGTVDDNTVVSNRVVPTTGPVTDDDANDADSGDHRRFRRRQHRRDR